MAQGNATIAALNEVAGKSSPRKRKHAINTDELHFSPAKKPRMTKSLKTRQSNSVGRTRTKRSSVEIPPAQSVPDGLEAVCKKVRKLNSRKPKQNHDSPLKNLGFDPADTKAPGRVNLNESPAKGTKSRGATTLGASTVLKKPEVQSTNVTPRKRRTRLSVREGDLAAPPSVWEDANKLSEVAQDPTGEAETEVLGNTVQVVVNEAEAKSQEVEPTQPPTSHPRRSPKKHTKKNNTTKPKSKPDPEAVMPSVEDAQVEDPGALDKRSKATESASMDKLELEEKLKRRGAQFTKHIEDATNVYGCESDWRDVGAAAYQIRSEYRGIDPNSTWGKAFQRRFEDLVQQYQYLKSDETEACIFEKTASIISRIEGMCKEIKEVEATTVRKDIVLDLFHHTVPNLVVVCRNCLKIFTSVDRLMAALVEKDLTRLLQIAHALADQAMSRETKPTGLGVGVRFLMRSWMRPQLGRIARRYDEQAEEVERREHEEKALDELSLMQEARLQSLARERKAMYRRPKPTNHGVSGRPYDKQPQVDLFDIDIIEHMYESSYINGLAKKPTQRDGPRLSRFERQETEDIAPPPSDWTEDEKVALLNALEQYQGEDRYWKISESCRELQTHSIDDLRTAALYFRELITSAPEFGEEIESKFPYLLSVE